MSSKISVFAVSWWQIRPGTTLFKHPLKLIADVAKIGDQRYIGVLQTGDQPGYLFASTALMDGKQHRKTAL